jgi:hypothetical protein
MKLEEDIEKSIFTTKQMHVAVRLEGETISKYWNLNKAKTP